MRAGDVRQARGRVLGLGHAPRLSMQYTYVSRSSFTHSEWVNVLHAPSYLLYGGSIYIKPWQLMQGTCATRHTATFAYDVV